MRTESLWQECRTVPPRKGEELCAHRKWRMSGIGTETVLVGKTAGLATCCKRLSSLKCRVSEKVASATEIVLSALPSSETEPYVLSRDRWCRDHATGESSVVIRRWRRRVIHLSPIEKGNERTRVLSFFSEGILVRPPKFTLSVSLKLIKNGVKDARHVLSDFLQVVLDVSESFLQIFVSLGGTGHVTTT